MRKIKFKKRNFAGLHRIQLFFRRSNMTTEMETGCQRFKRLIGVFKAEIKRLERSIRATVPNPTDIWREILASDNPS